jgi:hypothetical protein
MTSINSQVDDIECEYLKFHEVCAVIGNLPPGVLLAKFDIKDAFRLIRVRKEDQFLLGLRFMGLYYYERCLPFGLKPSPGIFEIFASAINIFGLEDGVKFLLHYLDDFILITNKERGHREYETVLSTFKKLGVELAVEKLSTPCSSLEFLGIIIDTVSMTLRLPEDKLTYYRSIINRWIMKPSGSLKELQSLIGTLVYSARIIQHGNTFYHHLIHQVREATKGMKAGKFSHRQVRLNNEAIQELQWWKYFIIEWNGSNIIPPGIDQFPLAKRHSLLTDACTTGMGAWFKGHQYVLHAWSEKELKEATREQAISMPYLELLSILHSVNVWQKELANNAIDLQSDCDPVVKAINKGYSREPSLHHLLRLLFFITSLNKIYISCSHIAGVDNKEADALSRAANHDNQIQNSLLTAHFMSLSSVQDSIKEQELVQKTIQPLPLEDWNSLKKN